MGKPAAELSVLRPVPQAGQTDRIWCSPCTPSEEFTAEKLRTLTIIRSPCATRRCRRVAKCHRGPGSATEPGLGRPALGIGVPPPARPARQREQWPAYRGAGRCVDGLRGRVRWYARFRRQHPRSRRDCRPGSPTRRSGWWYAIPAIVVAIDKSQPPTGCCRGRRSCWAHHGEEFTRTNTVSLPIAETPHPAQAPPG